MAAEPVVHQRISPHGAFPVNHAAQLAIQHKEVALPHVPVDKGGVFHFVENRLIRRQTGQQLPGGVSQIDLHGPGVPQHVAEEIRHQSMQGGEALPVAQQTELFAADGGHLALEGADLTLHMGLHLGGKVAAAGVQAPSGQAFHEEVRPAASGAGEIGMEHPRHMGQMVRLGQTHGVDFRLHHVDLVGQQPRGVRCGDFQHTGASVREIHPVRGVEQPFGQLGNGGNAPLGEGGGAHRAEHLRGLVILCDAHGNLLREEDRGNIQFAAEGNPPAAMQQLLNSKPGFTVRTASAASPRRTAALPP